jgi:dTMP kinase
MTKGKFVVIEGLEGAGKSSVIKAIAEYLQQSGISAICTREPGGTALAERIRECVKLPWPDEKVTPQTELLLMYASRSQLVENVISPALSSGTWVVGDRHDLSTRAYQGGGRQLNKEWLSQLKSMTLGNFSPDLTIYLDVSPEVGLSRARGRGTLDRIEQESLAFFQRVRTEYLSFLAHDPSIKCVNAEQPIEQVQQDVILALRTIM